MAVNWFYADAHNQQQGPVEKTWFASAYGAGTINAGTLVWREGLESWVPLRQVAAQLGLVIVGGAPPSPGSARSATRIAKPTSPSSGMWVIVLVVVLGLVAFVGILAAIALPAYQDYTVRAKVAGTFVQVDDLRNSVVDFFESQKRCPSNGEGDLKAPESYATNMLASIKIAPLENDECGITVFFATSGPRATAGKHFMWSMDTEGKWHFGSDIDIRYLPRSVRSLSQP
ncbi:MAG: GYF domain-containing protein [Dokdonella sp.]